MKSPVILLPIMLILCYEVEKVITLKCYECYSRITKKGCHGHFNVSVATMKTCLLKDYVCAIQVQQDQGTEKGNLEPHTQRGCYKRGSIIGIDESVGCREWVKPGTGYKAFYCFCENDLCNASNLVSSGFVITIIGYLIYNILR